MPSDLAYYRDKDVQRVLAMERIERMVLLASFSKLTHWQEVVDAAVTVVDGC
jgi:hypothetical protein